MTIDWGRKEGLSRRTLRTRYKGRSNGQNNMVILHAREELRSGGQRGRSGQGMRTRNGYKEGGEGLEARTV